MGARRRVDDVCRERRHDTADDGTSDARQRRRHDHDQRGDGEERRHAPHEDGLRGTRLGGALQLRRRGDRPFRLVHGQRPDEGAEQVEADRRLLRRPGEGLQDRLVRRRQSLQELGTGRGARRGEHRDRRRQAHRVPRLRQCVGRQHRPADQAARWREGYLVRTRTPLAHARLLHVVRGVQGRQRRLDGGRRSRRHERGGRRLYGRELQDQQGRRQHGRRRRLPARSVHLGGRLSRHEHDRDAGVRRPEHDGQFRPEPVRLLPGRRLG